MLFSSNLDQSTAIQRKKMSTIQFRVILIFGSILTISGIVLVIIAIYSIYGGNDRTYQSVNTVAFKNNGLIASMSISNV